MLSLARKLRNWIAKASNQNDHDLFSLSEKSIEYLVHEFKLLDEVNAKIRYTNILKAVKEVTSDDKIHCLINLTQLLIKINTNTNHDCLKNYGHTDEIGPFNLVSLACKNKAIKVLEYILSEESQTLYNLSHSMTDIRGNESILNIKDEFCHNAFYYAIRSNMTDLLRVIVNKWESLHMEEELDDILSKNYKELKLRNVPLTKEMQLFVQSKILDSRFFHVNIAGKGGTGNSWEQIEKRIKLVVKLMKSITNDYRDQDPDEKFIVIAEFIAKSIHVLKSLLKSTYDRLPWEEIEFCLVIFIKCCKTSSDSNLLYNCVLNKKQMLKHLFNFYAFLDKEHNKFKNSNVIKLAKSVNFPRETVIDKISEKNGNFRELYGDYEIIRDFYSLEIIKKYTDLIETDDGTEKWRHLLVSRILQAIGEHLKNSLDSPKISHKTANVLLSTLFENTRDILTKLRNALSHEEFLFIRSEMEKKEHLVKNVQRDILKIKALIPRMLYSLSIECIKSLMEKVELCQSIEDVKDLYGPYRHSLDLYSEEILKFNRTESDFELLDEFIQCLDRNINDKTLSENILFEQMYYLIQKERKRLKKYESEFKRNASAVSYLSFNVSKGNIPHLGERTVQLGNCKLEYFLPKFQQIERPLNELINRVFSRILLSENKELEGILLKFYVFLRFEMGIVKWIEDFSAILVQDTNKKTQRHLLSENLLKSKLLDLKEALIDFNLNDSTFSEECLAFEENMELRAVTEMLVLDILSILENTCSRNPFYLDSEYPLLSGKNLRNHLAHGNVLIDVSLDESSAQLLVNAKKILATVLPNESLKMDKVIKCDFLKLEGSIDFDIKIISNQQRLFDALADGNLKEIADCVSEGADPHGRDCKFSTCAHFAAKSPDKEALKWVRKQDISFHSKNIGCESILHLAAKFNRIEVMRYLVEEEKMSLVDRNINSKTPLHFAVENQCNDVVKYISKFQVCATLKDKTSSTPLHTAICRHNNNAARILLDKKTNAVESRAYAHRTALHTAVESGNLILVEFLIEKKANVDSKDDVGDTPLHLAMITKHFGIVQVLVLNGADVNATNEFGTTPLHVASEIGSVEIVDFLLQHGADISLTDCRLFTALRVTAVAGHEAVAEILLKNGASVHSEDVFGSTPLHYAAVMGYYRIVKLFLSHGAIIDGRNNDKETALYLSVFGGHEEIVKMLLEKGADINAESSVYTPLHTAVLGGYENLVHLLIDEGADLNCETEEGFTPLYLAAFKEDRRMVKYLLEKGANIKISGSEEAVPLNFKIAEILSDYLTADWIDVNFSDSNGNTLLHFAAVSGNLILVEHCIENGWEINARNISGLTVLHLAAQENHKEIISVLLNNGAQIDAKDDDGDTPLLLAARKNSREAVQFLVSHEKNDCKSITDDKILALRESVAYGNYDCVDILLKNYKFEITNELKQKLLNIAIFYGHKNILIALLERGFEIKDDSEPPHDSMQRSCLDIVEMAFIKDANPDLLDEGCFTPLDTAAKLGNVDMLEILLSGKTHLNIERKFILSASECAVRRNQLGVIKLLVEMNLLEANTKGLKDCTLLHTSALHGSLDITKYLVAEGANINMKDEKNRKPVHIAAAKGFKDMVEFYLNCVDLGDETAEILLIAADSGRPNVCKLLFERNPDLNETQSINVPPLHVALEKGHKDVILVLLQYGTYYNSHPPTLLKINDDNESSFILRKVRDLFCAVQNNKAADIEKLFEEESNSEYCLANAKCVKKQTVLHYVSWKGYEGIVYILLKHKANPNARSKTGETPLHYAVKHSHFSIVKALLSNGAIYNAVSQTGKSPLDYATDVNIKNFLLFLKDIFTGVQNKDVSVLENLREKDEDMIRSVIRAKNQENETLIDVAYFCGFPETNTLEMLLGNVLYEYNLVEKYQKEGKCAKAFSVLDTILAKTVERFGADTHPVLYVKELMAILSGFQGNPYTALQLFQEVYASRKQRLGEDHPITLINESFIAVSLLDQGKTKAAAVILEKVRFKLKKKLEPDDFDMIDVEMKYSQALRMVKRFNEAFNVSNEVQRICSLKNESRYQRSLIESKYNAGIIRLEQRKLVDALELFQEVYETRKVFIGLHNPFTLKALSKVAQVLAMLTRYDDSLKVIREVLDVQKSFLPDNHIDILESEFFIGSVISDQMRYLTALKIFLSIESKIADVAPDSKVAKATTERIATIKNMLSENGYECVFEGIQKDIGSFHVKSRSKKLTSHGILQSFRGILPFA